MAKDRKIEYGKLLGLIGLLLLIVSWVFYRISTHGSLMPLIILVIGILCIILYFVFDYVLIKNKLRASTFKKGIFSFVTTGFILAFLVTFYLFFSNNVKYVIDMTEDKVFELSLQSSSIVKKISFPLEILVFDKEENLEGRGDASLPTLLRFYKQANDNIKIKYIDPVKNPSLFRRYGLEGSAGIGSLVLKKNVLPKNISFDSMSNISSNLSSSSYKLKEIFKFYKKEAKSPKSSYVLDKGLSRNDEEELIAIFDSISYKYTNPIVLSNRDLFKGRDYQPEAKLTSAILSLLESKKYTLYVSKGHGEKSFSREYSNIKSVLALENYLIKDANLSESIPDDASIVFIAGPKRPFNSLEVSNLIEYSNSPSASILVLLDPAFQQRKLDNSLDKLFAHWNIKTDNSFIFDFPNLRQLNVQVGNVGGLPIAQRRIVQLSSYEDHVIVNPLKEGNISTFFFGLRPIYYVESKKEKEKEGKKNGGKDNVVGIDFLKTSSEAWLKKRGDTDQRRLSFNKQEDKKGSYSFGIALTKELSLKSVENDNNKALDDTNGDSNNKVAYSKNSNSLDAKDLQKPKSRFIIIGDSDFINNEYSEGENGVDLFMNALSWLSDQEKKITIRPKERKKRDIVVTAQSMNIIFYFSVFIMPFSIIGFGFYIYRKRKRVSN